MKKILCAAILLVPFLSQAQGQEDLWKPFRFVIGDWAGSGSGKPGPGTGEFSLKPELNNQILVRRNYNVYPDQKAEAKGLKQEDLKIMAGQAKGPTHEDLMIIYPSQDLKPYRAVYFDSEGHVIRYDISSAENELVFLSEAEPNAPRFRLTYHKKSINSLGIDFAMAPPNGDFHPYLSGIVTRK